MKDFLYEQREKLFLLQLKKKGCRRARFYHQEIRAAFRTSLDLNRFANQQIWVGIAKKGFSQQNSRIILGFGQLFRRLLSAQKLFITATIVVS